MSCCLERFRTALSCKASGVLLDLRKATPATSSGIQWHLEQVLAKATAILCDSALSCHCTRAVLLPHLEQHLELVGEGEEGGEEHAEGEEERLEEQQPHGVLRSGQRVVLADLPQGGELRELGLNKFDSENSQKTGIPALK